MLDGSYSGMQASVADFLNRSDISASIPDFITLAESDLNRKLRTRLMTAQATTTVNAQYEALPTDFAGMISMQDSMGNPINVRDPDSMALLVSQYANQTGSITDVAVIGGAFQLYPAPSTATTLSMSYYQRLPSLSLNPAGNWLSLKHPDAYLYGSLTAAAPYLQDDDRLAVWSGLYQNVIDGILNADTTERYGARLTPQPSLTQIV